MERTSPYSVRQILSVFRPLVESSAAGVLVRRELPPRWGIGFTEWIGIQPGLELVLTRYQLSQGLNLDLEVDQPMLSLGCVVTGKMFHQ